MPLKVRLVQGDITQMDVDVIVNSANNDLILGSGVSGAIHRIGGPEIQEECHRIGTIPLGHVAVTTGGKLKCRQIIHAAVNPLGMWADAKSIRSAFRGVLHKLVEAGAKTVAVPAIGTGAGGFSIDRCADLLLEEVRSFAAQPGSVEELIFVLFDEKSHAAFEERFARRFPDLWRETMDRPLPDLPPEPEPEPEELMPAAAPRAAASGPPGFPRPGRPPRPEGGPPPGRPHRRGRRRRRFPPRGPRGPQGPSSPPS